MHIPDGTYIESRSRSVFKITGDRSFLHIIALLIHALPMVHERLDGMEMIFACHRGIRGIRRKLKHLRFKCCM